MQASGERRTFACDTDLLRRYLDAGEAAWGIEAPVEIDLDQRLLMIFKPVSASAREAGAEGAMQVVPLYGPSDLKL